MYMCVVSRIKQSCFNCGGDHTLSACTQRRDMQRIDKNRRQFQQQRQSTGIVKQTRYSVLCFHCTGTFQCEGGCDLLLLLLFNWLVFPEIVQGWLGPHKCIIKNCQSTTLYRLCAITCYPATSTKALMSKWCGLVASVECELKCLVQPVCLSSRRSRKLARTIGHDQVGETVKKLTAVISGVM